jgi:thioredoxin reductase (NADPH)
MELYDIAVIGAGPCGLSCGIEARHRNLSCLVIDQGNIAESIRRYPLNMVFFSTSENLEIGGVPFVSMGPRPTRTEALKYYHKVAVHFDLNLQLFTRITGLEKVAGRFILRSEDAEFRCRHLILATGYYDIPRYLGIPGEDLPHVSHYYDEAFRYARMDIAVVGGANSAVETALDLYRHHARVTLIHLEEGPDPRVKYWVLPDVQNRIKNGEIAARFLSRVVQIRPGNLDIEHLETGALETISADFVFLMTGYRPDADFLRAAGIRLQGPNLIPEIDPTTYASNVPGLYLAGSVVGGEETAKIFIENGRHHAKNILDDICRRMALD